MNTSETAQVIVNAVCELINSMAVHTETETRYKSQEILEEVIKELNEKV